jgi:hypothetical protein
MPAISGEIHGPSKCRVSQVEIPPIVPIIQVARPAIGIASIVASRIQAELGSLVCLLVGALKHNCVLNRFACSEIVLLHNL